MMKSHTSSLTYVVVFAFLTAIAVAQPSITNVPIPPSTNTPNVYGNGRIYDISHKIRPSLPGYGDKKFTETIYWYLNRTSSFEPGKLKTQVFNFTVPAHASTHVDAPSHAIPKWQVAGYGVDTLDLETLNGPGLLVDVPRDKNITAEVLKSLNIPKGVKRVLFRTANTDRRLMWKPFESNYTGFTVDGAEWLVKNTDIKLIGIDYMSIAIGSKAENYVPPHQVLLANRDIIPVEALNLENVPAGAYNIHCLPLRLLGADGAPTRCILVK